jgi:peptidoglycan/xylan/chitin deacetylase (PgdA/CDA1 family)
VRRGVVYGLLGAAAWSAPAPAPVVAPVVPAFARAFGIRLRLDHTAGVALTFDDGPHPQGTEAVLEILARAGARATFFLVGEQVVRFPALAAEVAAAGHEVAVHGYRHRLQLRRTPWQLGADLDRAVATIGETTASTPALYRPPYGIFSLAGLAAVRARGLVPVLWTRWGRDWRAGATGPSIAATACSALEGGDVVVLHDADHYGSPGSWRNTAAALPSILDAVAALGADCCAVTQST